MPLRPSIDAKVFAFVEAHEFARRDFPQSGYNVHRLSREVTQLLLHEASLQAREIEATAEWMLKTIMGCAGAPQAKIDAVGKRRGRPTTRASDDPQGSPYSPVLYAVRRLPSQVLTRGCLRSSLSTNSRGPTFRKRGFMRIPTKPATHSNRKPATDSDLKPAGVPI